MNNKVDVLATIKAAAYDKNCQCGHPLCSRQTERAQLLATLAAVAELIEADREYEAARRDWDNATYGNPEDLEDEEWARFSSRFENAFMRRLTALNNVGGAA